MEVRGKDNLPHLLPSSPFYHTHPLHPIKRRHPYPTKARKEPKPPKNNNTSTTHIVLAKLISLFHSFIHTTYIHRDNTPPPISQYHTLAFLFGPQSIPSPPPSQTKTSFSIKSSQHPYTHSKGKRLKTEE